MLNPELRKEESIKAIVSEILLKADKKPEWGLNHEKKEKLEKRIKKIERIKKTWQLIFQSDGLSLKNKIALEKEILKELHQRNPLETFTLNFKRQHNLETTKGTYPSLKTSHQKKLDENKKTIPLVKNIIVVASGKGGVGKSTLSINLATAMQQKGFKVGLLDADVYGPSSSLMLGNTATAQVDKDQKLQPQKAHGISFVSFSFFSDRYNPLMWRGPMVAKALKQFCFDVAWGNLDLLVIDLPPGTGDVQLSLIETLKIDQALVITTPQDIALIDAHKAISMFEKLNIPIAGIIENMAYHQCSNCGHKENTFGYGGTDILALQRKIAILNRIPLNPEIRRCSDEGKPISLQKNSPLAKVYHDIALQISRVLSL